MYFYGAAGEYPKVHQEQQENYEYGASSGTSTGNGIPKWVLPVTGVSVVVLVGLWFLMKKRKPAGQKFGFKFY